MGPPSAAKAIEEKAIMSAEMKNVFIHPTKDADSAFNNNKLDE